MSDHTVQGSTFGGTVVARGDGLRGEVVDSLPLTPVGKVDKKALRARFWSGEGRSVH